MPAFYFFSRDIMAVNKVNIFETAAVFPAKIALLRIRTNQYTLFKLVIF